MRLAIVLVIGLSSTARADGVAKDAAGWCTLHPGETLPETATITWRGTLDGDGNRDVIANLGDCGTRECIYTAYVRCRDGTYSQVFSGYASRIRVRPGSGWARFEVEHVGDPDRTGNRSRSWSRVPFTADGYQER